MNGRTKYQFDNCAAVDFLEAKNDPAIWPNDLETSERYASLITRMEFLSYPLLSAEDEDERKTFIDSLSVIPITRKIEETAIHIRRTKRLKLPDAITAATAIVIEAVLITSDPHLLTFEWPGLKLFRIPGTPPSR
jgi:predicted nucleic acid-binding protein